MDVCDQFLFTKIPDRKRRQNKNYYILEKWFKTGNTGNRSYYNLNI